MADWNVMNKIIQITLATQAVGLVVFLAWMVLRPTAGDPSLPFKVLQQFVQKYGPARAVDVLGVSIFRKASALCRRNACIQARYGGNRGRWLMITATKQRDPCIAFQHPPCGRSAIRTELKKVLTKINSCNVVGKLNRGSAVRLRVQCGSIQDFVTVERGPGNQWTLAGDERYPGFLPRLHASAGTRRP